MAIVDTVTFIAIPWLSASAAVTLWATSRGVPLESLASGTIGATSMLVAVVILGQALWWAAGRNRHQFAPEG